MTQLVQLELLLQLVHRIRMTKASFCDNCCHYDYALLVSVCSPRVNSSHHLAAFASVPGRTPQPCISPFLFCIWAEVRPSHASRMLCLRVSGQYSPAMHHVARSAPQPCLSNAAFACDWGTLANHAPCGRECSPNHASYRCSLRVAWEYSPALLSPFLFRCGRGVFPAMPHVAREYSPPHVVR